MKPEEKKLQKFIPVRVNAADHQKIENLAKQKGISRAEFIRRLISDQK